MVEDDTACRHALTQAILSSGDMHLVWQAATLADARARIAQPIDVLLVDLGLPDGSGLDLIREIRETQPTCQVMVSTMFGDDANLMAAITAGALGYLLKDVSAGEVIGEIRNLHAGGSPINPMMARKLLQGQTFAPTPPAPQATEDEPEPDGRKVLRLSLRETEVLQLVARGYVLEEVATRMGITRHTARSFVRRIYQKLQVNTRVEAVRLAIAHGLVPKD